MIVVKLQGGLGNQMFQYAFGQALGNATGKPVKYDTREFGKRGRQSRRWRWAKEFLRCKLSGRDWRVHRANLRLLDLEYFTPDLPEADDREIAASKGDQSHPSIFKEQSFSPDDVARAQDGYYDGTWSLDYLKSIADQVPRLFPVKANADQVAPAKGSVCVHVRRGDFTNPAGVKKHGLCQPAYFESAASAVCQKATSPLRFYVFSDDIPWCQENLRLPHKTVFMEHLAVQSPALSMDIMRQCEHFILSNSTFSLWAAFLGNKPGTQIVTPFPWFDRDPTWTSGLSGDLRLDKVTGRVFLPSAHSNSPDPDANLSTGKSAVRRLILQ